MKKLILLVAIGLAFFNHCVFADYPAFPIELNAFSVVPLNSFAENKVVFSAYSPGPHSAGLCRLIIRSSSGQPSVQELAERFKFLRSMNGQESKEVTPIVNYYAIMFKLQHNDFSYEKYTIETKDGKSIADNIKAVIGDLPVAVMLGTCYSR